LTGGRRRPPLLPSAMSDCADTAFDRLGEHDQGAPGPHLSAFERREMGDRAGARGREHIQEREPEERTRLSHQQIVAHLIADRWTLFNRSRMALHDGRRKPSTIRTPFAIFTYNPFGPAHSRNGRSMGTAIEESPILRPPMGIAGTMGISYGFWENRFQKILYSNSRKKFGRAFPCGPGPCPLCPQCPLS
jgi:hypothetical protein